MVVNDRITAYLQSLEPDTPYEALEQSARERYVPVIRKETAALLNTLIAVKRPARILEVGTAIGYSTLLMCRIMPESCRIVTIENDPERALEARKHFEEAEETRITLIEGDAGEVLKDLEGGFDFIFMDAAKGQYANWLPLVLRLLSEGGVLISDNVLQDGEITESRFAVERRNRTIHSRMREYLYQLKHTEGMETAIVPIGDGVAISTIYREGTL